MAAADSNTNPPDMAMLDGSNVTYSAWSRSYVELYTIAHEWTIDNFVQLDDETQIIFRVVVENNEELKFKVSLKPKYGESGEYLSVYVHNLNLKELKYSITFNILDINREKRLSRRADTRIHAIEESWGFPKFCSRSEILNHASDRLPGGALTLLCEIAGFKKIVSKSDYQKVRGKFNVSDHYDLNGDLKRASSLDMAYSDMVLQCGTDSEVENKPDHIFPCHKFMLAARSDVFKAMFSTEMKEARQNKVILNDTSPTIAKEFLKFIYSDSFDDVSFETVSKLLLLAHQYGINKLGTLCSQHLLQSMNENNASEIAIIGQVCSIKLLKERAIEFICQYPEEVLKSRGWSDLLKQTPEVCSAIICRLSRVGSEREGVVLTSATKSNASFMK